jgi:hypothetical protein
LYDLRADGDARLERGASAQDERDEGAADNVQASAKGAAPGCAGVVGAVREPCPVGPGFRDEYWEAACGHDGALEGDLGASAMVAARPTVVDAETFVCCCGVRQSARTDRMVILRA